MDADMLEAVASRGAVDDLRLEAMRVKQARSMKCQFRGTY